MSYTKIEDFSQTRTWVCPANTTSVNVECWGGGGAGGGGNSGAGTSAGSGGGGGAYSEETAATVVPGTSYTVTVGVGGAAVSNGTGGTGGDSWFNSTGTVLAKGGTGGAVNGGAVGSGGAAGSGVGDITKSGGNGGLGSNNNTFGSGGGGGGAGDNGNGGVGGDGAFAAAGAGGNKAPTIGGPGAPGRTNSNGNGTDGLPPGGGGSGGYGDSGTPATGGAGSGGFVRLTYTTTTPPPSSNTDLINPFTSLQVGDVGVDDGDYWIQTGVEYLIAEFKKDWTNNTDNIYVTWKGRTTQDPRISFVYLQIYNVNSAIWETLDIENMRPADTDFVMQGSQTTNLSNYYDSKNIVSFRIYQQVI